MKEEMSLEEFKEFCKKEDYNHVEEWDTERFKITCNKCQSNDVIVVFREEAGGEGSEYTGYMHGFIHMASMLVKCKSCGHAMDVNMEYLKRLK